MELPKVACVNVWYKCDIVIITHLMKRTGAEITQCTDILGPPPHAAVWHTHEHTHDTKRHALSAKNAKRLRRIGNAFPECAPMHARMNGVLVSHSRRRTRRTYVRPKIYLCTQP